MNDFATQLQQLPLILPVLVASLVLHELGHAVVGTLLGDPTPRQQGRLTLNPIKHLDPFGSAVFLFTFLFTPVPFGWARPVIINPRQLPHPQRGMALVAVAGPLVNFSLALVLYALAVHIIDLQALSPYMLDALNTSILINIVLGVFNLLPVPPLDGSRIVGAFMPRRMYEDWSRLDAYAPLFIIVLVVFMRQPLGALLTDATGRVFSVLQFIVYAGDVPTRL